MTTAAMTQVSTTPSTTQIHVLTLPATGCLGELPGFVDTDGIAALLAERLAPGRVSRGGRSIAASECHPPEFNGGPAADPERRVLAGGGLEVLCRQVETPTRPAGGA